HNQPRPTSCSSGLLGWRLNARAAARTSPIAPPNSPNSCHVSSTSCPARRSTRWMRPVPRSRGRSQPGTSVPDLENKTVKRPINVVDTPRYYASDFWRGENLKYVEPHFRMLKAARILTRLAKDREVSLLDIGCGPATLRQLLPASVKYHGIDI